MSRAKREIMHNRRTTAERKSGMTDVKIDRRYPIGAEVIVDGRVHFRVWAPKAKRLEVGIEGEWGTDRGAEAPAPFAELQSEPDGYFSAALEAKAGSLYRFRLDGTGNLYPSPA